MKETFFRLSSDKRTKIEKAALDEFGESGYERGSLDRIIEQCGISKGGLYEYISSKEELFLHTVNITFDGLYEAICNGLSIEGESLDLLDRFHKTAEIAVDFYLANPERVKLLVQCSRLTDQSLIEKTERIFLSHFDLVFGNKAPGDDNLKYNRNKILDLLRWVLVKTRNDFVIQLAKLKDENKVKKAYMENWEFHLDVLRYGVYNK